MRHEGKKKQKRDAARGYENGVKSDVEHDLAKQGYQQHVAKGLGTFG